MDPLLEDEVGLLEDDVLDDYLDDFYTKTGQQQGVDKRLWWQIMHAFDFCLGGFTFILGTCCYFFKDWTAGLTLAALLYTIGSCGFLAVDVQEFFTFKENKLLRANIFMSASGSFFYVLGSVGYFPFILDVFRLGEIGFIIGSFLIGVSQCWKVYRIGCDDGSFSPRNIISSKDNFTAVGVEADAGIGAWCFFFGTIFYLFISDFSSWEYTAVLLIWLAGSAFFSTGGLFLSFRHFVMKI